MKQYHDLVKHVLENGHQKGIEQELEQLVFWIPNAF